MVDPFMTTTPLASPLSALRSLVDALTPPLTDTALNEAIGTAHRTLEAYEPIPSQWNPDTIRAMRRQHQWTQPQAAAHIGISLSTYRDWEQGRRKPSEQSQRLLDQANERG
jgi:DNA-binding transcriptional regulator YiaG